MVNIFNEVAKVNISVGAGMGKLLKTGVKRQAYINRGVNIISVVCKIEKSCHTLCRHRSRRECEPTG